MSTFLLTWNPKRYPWREFDNLVAKASTVGPVDFGWSCGNNKSIRPSDRVFLLRQGGESAGIVGSGWVTVASHQGRPFDDSLWLQVTGQKANVLLNQNSLPIDA